MTHSEKDALIQRLQKENAVLKARIEKLERLLGMNSQNSSKPPSSDPPNAPKKNPPKKQKKPGAKKGLEPHLKEMLPPDKVNRSHVIEPEICSDCGGRHLIQSDQKPLRSQFIDVPPVKIDVTEYVRPVRECADCGALVYAPLPDNAPKSCFGSGVLALVAVLTGVLNVSKRKAMLVMNEVFNVPMSLGGLSNCEERIANSLAVPYDEASEHIREQQVAHADETGWRRGNRAKGWLWTLCSSTAAVFMVHAKRGQEAARKLLDNFFGVLVSDRWGGYNFFKGLRQICWAHLKRDFTAISEAGGRLGQVGAALHDLAKRILQLRACVRDGTLKWGTFQSRISPLTAKVEELLQEGALYDGALGGKCREIFKHRAHLWTFVSREDVEPTNNHAERMVRQGVLWRKSSFGTQSERGARYVERVLTAGATCRLQGRSVIEFMRDACRCHTQNLPAPSLIA
ncbi:MAG: IS66 family transposase [bacterium]